MIVVSKRVFLNVLTQLMDAQALVDANYYIADQRSRDGTVVVEDEYRQTADGSYVLQPRTKTVSGTLSRFHVKYGSGVLSPASLSSQILVDAAGKSTDRLFQELLLQSDSFIDVYRFLYDSKPKGNGLRILIFTRDDSAPYMHIVCAYISRFFGEDITFIDRAYRNDIPGDVNYRGDVMNARETIQMIRRKMTMNDLSNLITSYQFGSQSRSNLEVYFDTFSIPDLFKLYEMLFPNQPLEAGNYTKEQIMYILVSKIIAEAPKMVSDSMSIQDMFSSIPELYSEVSDDELMQMHE